ncbi:MAG: SRPBCC family protein [Deltaproteobacteria bacterium]|nr:SRPBCC family protein [Deltaproteobacteria bacterium]
MIQLEETIVSELGAERTFRYVADFAHLPEWDPGIVSARRTTAAPLGLGTRFELVASVLGRRVPMVYEVAGFEPPRRVVLHGEAPGLRAVDEIQIEPIPGFGSRLRYRADFDLGRFGWLVEPFLRRAFVAMGKRALAGLEAELRRAAASAPAKRAAPSERQAAAWPAAALHDRKPPRGRNPRARAERSTA